MGKNKNFLPVSQRDVEIPLVGSVAGPAAAVAAMGQAGLSGPYQEAVTQNRRGLPKATKTKSWVMKMFSAFTFIGLIFGGTIIGFSFKMIGDNQVGYYNSESGYMGPGTYFQFPWTKEELKIVDVGIKFMRLERLMGVLETNDQEFMIQNANVVYNVSDVDTYVQTLKHVKSPVYCQAEIENAVLDDIISTTIPDKLLSLKELRDIVVPDCGITVERVVVSRPIFTQKNPVILNMNDQPQVTYQTQEDETTNKPTTTTTMTKRPVTEPHEVSEDDEGVPTVDPDRDDRTVNLTLHG
jgi:hypothetical protein